MDTCVSLGSVWHTWWQLEPVCSHVVYVVTAVAVSVTDTLGEVNTSLVSYNESPHVC